LGTFVQAYGSRYLDASLLAIPLVGFLPADDARVVQTVDAIMKTLMADGLLLRYDVAVDDGLPPGQGAFLPCTFWLVEALAAMDRRDEAAAILDRLLTLRNDVGLLAEQYDVGARRLTGNFPQAFSHVGLVNAVMAMEFKSDTP
jgi:GH15 family glucan-1,4-alpha-glucosidase